MVDKESFGDFLRRRMNVCPNCEGPIGEGVCCFTHTEWTCWGCGAHLDSRVVTPKTVLRCENAWPDYIPRFGEPAHPTACSCSGRGWYGLEAPAAAT